MPRARRPSPRRLVKGPEPIEARPVQARPLLPAGEVDFGGGVQRTGVGLSNYGLHEGTAVILFLREPKDKIWGLLVSLGGSGIVVRGMDLRTFEEWMRQEARHGDDALGPSTIFYPMHRIERMERDESVGMIISFADRFHREVGRTVNEAMGIG